MNKQSTQHNLCVGLINELAHHVSERYESFSKEPGSRLAARYSEFAPTTWTYGWTYAKQSPHTFSFKCNEYGVHSDKNKL